MPLNNPADTTALKMKLESRALDAASGDVAYTGYGFTPSALLIVGYAALYDHSSIGSAEPALTECCLWLDDTPAGEGAAILGQWGIGNGQSCVLKTFDTDGFTLTWTKIGTSSAGPIALHCYAFK